jgi:hypothetical protein
MKDAHTYKDLLLLGTPITHVAVLVQVFGNDLYNASERLRAIQMEGLRGALRGIGNNIFIQSHLGIHHNDEKTLTRYANKTAASKREDASTLLRDQIFIDYSEQNKNRELKQIKNLLYLTKELSEKIPVGIDAKERVQYEKTIVEEAERELVSVIDSFNNSMQRSGAYLERLTSEDIFLHYTEVYNPSFADRKGFDPLKKFDPTRSILDQVMRGGITSGYKLRPNYGFCQDEYLHNFVIVSRPPRNLTPGMIKDLSNLKISDFRIITNVYPVDSKKLLKTKQKELNRVLGDSDAEAATTSSLKQRMIADIANGYKSFEWMMVFHVWDKSFAGLTAKTQVVKDAIHEWDDADYYVASLPATARNIWFQCQPGYPHGKYRDHCTLMNDSMLARVFNMDASFHGDTANTSALYKNHNDGLVGVGFFKNGTPLPFTIIGMPGAGKSHLLRDMLMQLLPELGYLVIIEEGLSHKEIAEAYGTKPMIIHPNSNLCFNPFDTGGLPFSSSFLESLSTLLTRMFGNIGNESEKLLFKAYIEFYCRRLYNDIFNQRTKRNSSLKFNLAKETLAAFNFWQSLIQTDLDTDFIDAWNQMKELKITNPQAVELLYSQCTEEKIVDFMKSHETSGFVRDVFISTLTKEEHPTLSQLVGSLEFPHEGHDSKRIEVIVTILRTWCRHQGSKGGLFDGIRNLPDRGRISLWELSKLGEDDSELKQLVGFQISHFERNRIMEMPRNIKKMFLIEEGSKYLSIPGAEKTVNELYAQMRKYSCVTGFTVQFYAQFKDTSVASIVMGASKQHFLLRQVDIDDINDICKRIPSIPESAREAVMRYPMPESNGFNESWFTYYQMGSNHPMCGTVKFEKRRIIE